MYIFYEQIFCRRDNYNFISGIVWYDLINEKACIIVRITVKYRIKNMKNMKNVK